MRTCFWQVGHFPQPRMFGMACDDYHSVVVEKKVRRPPAVFAPFCKSHRQTLCFCRHDVDGRCSIRRQRIFCDTDDKGMLVKGTGPDPMSESNSAVFSMTRWTPFTIARILYKVFEVVPSIALITSSWSPRTSYNHRNDYLLRWDKESCQKKWDPRGSTCVEGRRLWLWFGSRGELLGIGFGDGTRT